SAKHRSRAIRSRSAPCPAGPASMSASGISWCWSAKAADGPRAGTSRRAARRRPCRSTAPARPGRARRKRAGSLPRSGSDRLRPGRCGEPMPHETIDYALADGVATIRLDRPERMNALNATMRRELVDALSRAGAQARAVVLTGNGAAFCAGQDLGDVEHLGDL